MTGMNMLDALRQVRRWGWTVRPVRRTGEMLVIAPGGERVRFNRRRKDASRRLTTFMRRNFYALKQSASGQVGRLTGP